MKLQAFLKIAGTILFIFSNASVFAETSTVQSSVGHSEGNHRLDCTVVRPWPLGDPPEQGSESFAVIGWANGWGQGNVQGADQTGYYLSGLEYWAREGNYLVIAANQWSPRSPDVLQCAQWLIDQNYNSESEYYLLVDVQKIGVAGHSQGGGAALKAGDGVLFNGDTPVEVSTVVAMNPYGPSFIKAKNQNGQIMVLGGDKDFVTPTDSFSKILDGIIRADNPGGVQAILTDGTHCIDACRDDFGDDFGPVSLLWWNFILKQDDDACTELKDILNASPWTSEFSPNFSCN
jgi:dienelactone hydrolase